MTAVRVGVHLPQWKTASYPRDAVVRFARCAEEAGLDSVWVADHIAFPLQTQSAYPGKSMPYGPEDGLLEALTTLAVVAGATSRIGLGTSVLVPPLREPLLLAKTTASLDYLSGGRLELGVGAGWLEAEFAAVGVDFSQRGHRLDEQLEVLTQLWMQGRGDYDGSHVRFPFVVSEPRPVRTAGPPLWIGGMSERALARVVRHGHGWHTVGTRSEDLAAGRRRLEDLAQSAGRDPSTILVSTTSRFPKNAEGFSARLDQLSSLGVDQVVLGLPEGSVDEMCGQVRALARHLASARDTPTEVPC